GFRQQLHGVATLDRDIDHEDLAGPSSDLGALQRLSKTCNIRYWTLGLATIAARNIHDARLRLSDLDADELVLNRPCSRHGHILLMLHVVVESAVVGNDHD